MLFPLAHHGQTATPREDSAQSPVHSFIHSFTLKYLCEVYALLLGKVLE